MYPIYLALLLNGTIRAFNGPGRSGLPAADCPTEHFPNAVAWSSSIFQAATILGPSAGGLIYGLDRKPGPGLRCAAVFYLTALALDVCHTSRMRVRPRGHRFRRGALSGLRYIWNHKLILAVISLDLFAVLLGGAVALLPVYAREILKVGASGLGLLRAAPGVGAVITAVLWLTGRFGAVRAQSCFGASRFRILHRGLRPFAQRSCIAVALVMVGASIWSASSCVTP